MRVKGILLEDDQGKELVMMCLSTTKPFGKTFQLRGWQRRRLVPIRCTEQESNEIMEGVRLALKLMGTKSLTTI